MNYLQIPGDSTAIVWQDEEGHSGVLRMGESGWDDYQDWLAVGNKLGSMTAVDARSIDDLRASAIVSINALADTILVPITSLYPKTEIDSWPEQCMEAKAWIEDQVAPTLLIDTITGPLDAAQKGAFCASILSKADEYKVVVGAVIGWRRACSDWVEAQVSTEPLVKYAPQFPEVPHG